MPRETKHRGCCWYTLIHIARLPAVWPSERLAALRWGVMADNTETTDNDRGEKYARRVRLAMWGAAAVLVVVIAVMALRSVYSRGVSKSQTEECQKLGLKC